MEKVRPGSTLTDSPVGRVLVIATVIFVVIVILLVGWFIFFGGAKQDPSLSVVLGDPSELKFVVTTVIGDVKVERSGRVVDIEVNDVLFGGDVIITGNASECIIQMGEGVSIKVLENTKISLSGVLPSLDKKKESVITLVSGIILSITKKLGQQDVRVRTETGLALVRGTKFSVYSKPNGDMTIVVADGEVVSKIRSRFVGELASKLKPEEREKLILLEGISESVVKGGMQSDISRSEQSKVDQKLKSLSADGKLDNIDDFVSNLSRAIETVSKEVEIKTKEADKDKLDFLNRGISEDVLVDFSKMVEVVFEPTEDTLGFVVSVDDGKPSIMPVSKMLVKNKKYSITIKNRFGDTVFRDVLSFDRNMRVIVKRKGSDVGVEIGK
ncbi:MAG: FecR family protein [Brevinematia bacterium]